MMPIADVNLLIQAPSDTGTFQTRQRFTGDDSLVAV